MNIKQKSKPAFRINCDAFKATISGLSYTARNGFNKAQISASADRGDVGKVHKALRILEDFMFFNGVIRHGGNLSAQTTAGNNGRIAF